MLLVVLSGTFGLNSGRRLLIKNCIARCVRQFKTIRCLCAVKTLGRHQTPLTLWRESKLRLRGLQKPLEVKGGWEIHILKYMVWRILRRRLGRKPAVVTSIEAYRQAKIGLILPRYGETV